MLSTSVDSARILPSPSNCRRFISPTEVPFEPNELHDSSTTGKIYFKSHYLYYLIIKNILLSIFVLRFSEVYDQKYHDIIKKN